MVNPRVYDGEKRDGALILHFPESAQPTTRWHKAAGLRRIWQRGAGRLVRLCKERFVFWPAYLSREMSARSNARSELINLSDGGHTGDNIGLYPLLQRRCDLIIACDAECDPVYAFESLTAAIGQIFTDENVKVSIDLDEIRAERKDASPQKKHFVIGRIEYPECDPPKPTSANESSPNNPAGTAGKQSQGEKECADPDCKGKVGWLIYLKASFWAQDEPVTVTTYAALHKAFPHESTTDQFFDDDQFEAYRSLGNHIARTVLADAGLLHGNDKGPTRQRIFAKLREFCCEEWKPTKTQLLEALQECEMKTLDTAKRLYSDGTTRGKQRVERLAKEYEIS